MASSKFSYPPQTQKPPAVCKKPTIPPIFPDGCPTTWPNATTWLVQVALTVGGLPAVWNTTIDAPAIAEANYQGNTFQTVDLMGVPTDIRTFLAATFSPSNCAYSILITIKQQPPTPTNFRQDAVNSGVYSGGLPFAFPLTSTTTFHHPGTIFITGSP